MTLSNLNIEAYFENEAELSKIITVDDTHIVINIPGDRIDGKYEIALSRIETPEQVVSWIFHLSAKTWMTRDILRRFIKVASNHAGISL